MKTIRHSLQKLFFSILLATSLLLTACSTGGKTSPESPTSQSTESKEFTEFTDQLFRETVSSDALSLNYTLSKPDKYGINPTCGGFSPISLDSLKNAAPETENLLYSLKEFDKSELTLPQQLLYDSLAYTLEMDKKGAGFIMFSRPLSPVTGLQAQLPVLLAEYNFDSVEDIENYFSLLESIPRYFDSVLSFLEIQAKEHMLPSRDTLETIAGQCLSFTQNNGSRILLTSFRSRTKSCTFLDSNAKKNYRKKNKELVRSCITPAYEQLIHGLTVISAMAGTDGALSSYPKGKEYYSHLFAQETGSSVGVEEYFRILNDRLNKSRNTLLSYAKKNPALFSGLSTKASGNLTPEERLTSLSTAILKDFPQAADVNFTVSYVDKSLEDYLSPAFYLTPPLDAFTENVIYINNSSRFAGSDISTTLAHEGYPGHLYQNVFHRQQNHPLLSYALNFSGYTEGWATYAELYSYKYLGYSKDEVGILRNNMIVSLCIYGICDIGIHYYGWDEAKVLEFLNQNGNYPEDTAHSLYKNIIDEPGSYLKYTIGYMEFAKLKDAARKQLGKNFSEKSFHQYVLSAGPAPFPVLESYMKQFWPEQNN